MLVRCRFRLQTQSLKGTRGIVLFKYAKVWQMGKSANLSCFAQEPIIESSGQNYMKAYFEPIHNK